MALFRHILYPVDFSARCLSIRPFVAGMARQMRAPVTLLHAIPMPRGWFSGVEGAYPAFFDLTAFEQDALKRLESLRAEPEFAGLGVSCLVNQGDPALAITEFANEREHCLVMIPTHGHGKFRNLLLGSVTAKVLHDAAGPVWTDAHVEDPQAHLDPAHKRIVCGIALDGKDDAIVHQAVELAGHDSTAVVRLVHAVPVEEMRPQKYFSLEFDRFLMDIAKEKAAELQSRLGTDLQVCVRGGTVSHVMRQTALLHGADLIVIGRGVVKETLGRLRTNAYSIIRDAPCPVLSL